MEHPRLRDSKHLVAKELYPLNVFPKDLITQIGSYFVYLLYVGRTDLTGNDWGDAFAEAIKGIHLDSPVGIADVVLEKNCWSMKTVKNTNPFHMATTRLPIYDSHRSPRQCCQVQDKSSTKTGAKNDFGNATF